MSEQKTKSERLYYLDWLRVLLLFGVFIYHSLKPFDEMMPWHINNVGKSGAVTGFFLTVNPWGIPLFFLVSGAGCWFALRKRSNRQFIKERVNRLLIPFVIGAILLTPIQKYLEYLNMGKYQGSFFDFLPILIRNSASVGFFTPRIFGIWGLHLWFLGFLFSFSLLAVPIFTWLKKDDGQKLISWLAQVVEKRGGIFIFIIPLYLLKISIQSFFPMEEHGWVDFVYFFPFFIYGFIFMSDDSFVKAAKRDRWLLFTGAMLGLVVFGWIFAANGDIVFEWSQTFVFPWFFVLLFSFVLIGWGFALNVVHIISKYLNTTNKFLEYAKGTIMPFYLFHQPVIIGIAFFVVKWDLSIGLKMLIIISSSLILTLVLVELLIRPFKPLRKLFGMKARKG